MNVILEHTVHIKARKEQVWEALADFGNVYLYAPTVKSSHSTSANTTGEGTTRHCELHPLGSLDETASDWVEGQGYVISIDKGAPFFMKDIKTSFNLGATDEGGTIASVESSYDIKFGPVGAFIHSLILKPRLEKAFPLLLLGLKQFVETGAPVTRETLKAS